MRYQYDMAVIGGGAAGLTAAGMSALLGAKTVLIEQHKLGGECTWTGCIPSKTLLRASRVAHQMTTADRFGLKPVEPQVDFAKVMEHVRHIREHVYKDADAPPHLEKLGAEVIQARARFLDPHTVEMEGASGRVRLTSRFYIVATGSRPKLPQFAESALTNETIFELKVQPKRLVILGAGPVGIEMAQAFQRLGSEVTVVAQGDRILPRDDPGHANQLRECLAGEGVSFVFGQEVRQVEKLGGGLAAVLKDGRTLSCDALLAAIGREPSLSGLQLEKAGIRLGENGVEIDRYCRTSQRHIFAVGDVTGRYQFTHMAEHMSKVAVTNAILRWPKALDEKHVVWTTFTEPELAHLGESEQQLVDRDKRLVVLRMPFSRLDRAITDSESTGEVKVFADRRGRIMGASILGSQAGEMISEWALAMRNGLTVSQIGDTIHPYPTYMLGNRKTADQFAAKQLDSPLLLVLKRAFGYRGELRGSRALDE